MFSYREPIKSPPRALCCSTFSLKFPQICRSFSEITLRMVFSWVIWFHHNLPTDGNVTPEQAVQQPGREKGGDLTAVKWTKSQLGLISIDSYNSCWKYNSADQQKQMVLGVLGDFSKSTNVFLIHSCNSKHTKLSTASSQDGDLHLNQFCSSSVDLESHIKILLTHSALYSNLQ